MFKSPVAAALVIGGLAVTAACASSPGNAPANSPTTSASTSPTSTPSASAGSSASPTSSPTGISTAPAVAHCAGSTPVAGPVVRVTASDEGRSLCVTQGTELVVLLQGTVVDRWVGIHSSSPAILKPQTDPGVMLQVGWSGAAFLAANPGTAYISASRYPCGSASPHAPKLECGVIIGYRVNVVVVP